MKIIVTTDSTSDIPKHIAEQNNIAIMPLLVDLGEETFEDGVNINAQQIFDFVSKTGILPKTGARSSELYKEFFIENLKKNSADALIHISLSSEISSSYSNAYIASQELENVKVIDSRSLSTGCALLVLSAVDKINENKNLEQICCELEAEKSKVQASFVIDSLKYLYKGGRCSALAMFGANVLRIKPKIKVENGKMGVSKKFMGKFEVVVSNYASDLLKDCENINKKRVFITSTTKDQQLIQNLEKLLQEKGFEEIIINTAGSTISSHCGENTLGILFMFK